MSKRVLSLIKENHEKTIFKTLGMELVKVDADETIVEIAKVDERHFQHVGLVHGGFYVLLTESAASIAAACNLEDPTKSVVALEINANHLRSVRSGGLKAMARPLHKGQRTYVYECQVLDQKDRLISIARCTLMVVNLEK